MNHKLVSVNKKDPQLLRELGSQVAEIAAMPVQQETIAAWKALNRLKPVRPMFMIDQMPWHEVDVNGELELQTEDPFCREIETKLRQTLYRWRHLRTDMVVPPVIEDRAASDPASNVVGHYYIDQLKTEDDLEKIRFPEVELDEPATARAEGRAHEILDGVLEVKMQGALPVFPAWDWIVTWHGVEASLMDLSAR